MEETISPITSLTFRNASLALDTPVAMGILNVTPDSFADGGKYDSVQQAVDAIGTMLDEGAAMIDIGGESTRPGADSVSVAEEVERVLPVLEAAMKGFPGAIFSIDTTKHRVAEESLKLGAHIINDISGLQKDPRLAELCAKYNAGYVLMHSQGDPKTMQKNPEYEDVVRDIHEFLTKGIEKLEQAGVQSVIIDPGIGFGKTLRHNLKLIDGLDRFTEPGYPVLVGASRKSMIGMLLEDRPVDGRLAGTLAIHYHCMLRGAKILRVHDVKEAVDTIKIFNALTNSET